MDAVHQKLVGAGEIGGGVALMTTMFWSPLFDMVVTGAHAVAALGGAVIAVHGVYRIIKGVLA